MTRRLRDPPQFKCLSDSDQRGVAPGAAMGNDDLHLNHPDQLPAR